jgi:hypothetical protein
MKKAFRKEAVGPLTPDQKNQIKGWLISNNETIGNWGEQFTLIVFSPTRKRWEDYHAEKEGDFCPSIAFNEFKQKYV